MCYQEAMNCCASSGVVLDTTQVVCMENFTYGMYNLTRARNYSALDFSGLFDDASKKDLKVGIVLFTQLEKIHSCRVCNFIC